MEQIYTDLWQTAAEHPFAGLTTHAYLLVRRNGNVLFYNSSHAEDHQHIQELSGITRQYLSHRDEAGPTMTRIRELFGSKLACHELEVPAVSQSCPVDLTFKKRGIHLGDIEVIPTPGHTDGSTSFLYQSPNGKTYLFSGDTIFLNKGAWTTFVMPNAGGSKSDMAASLRLLRELEPDVVISSASVGDVAFEEMTPRRWLEAVDRALASL